MLSRAELAEIAMRHDTAMAHAMLRALGIEIRRARRPRLAESSRWHGMGWARRNHGSPMDGRR